MRKIQIALFILLVSQLGISSAQIPDTAWTKTYGGPEGEGAHDIDRTLDGGYIVTGENEPNYANKNAYLLKIDTNGDTVWTTDFGGTNTDEYGRSVRQTSDGGFIICGYAGVSQSNEVFLWKTDSLGGTEWYSTFGPTPDNRGHCVRQTSDGGFIIAGQAWIIRGAFGSYDMYVIKTNSAGGLEWERFIGGSSPDFGLGVCEMQNGDFMATGRTLSSGGWDAYLVRLSPYGDSVWARGVGVGAQDDGYSILALPDGSGVILTGQSYSYTTGSDVFLYRADNDGNLLWTRLYGGNDEEFGTSLVPTPDGGYAIAGMKATYQTGWNVLVVKTDSLGNEQWSTEFGASGDDRGHGITCDPDGAIVAAGWTSSYGGGWLDVYLVKFEGVQTAIDDEPALPLTARLDQNYPNPFNAGAVISYSIPVDGRVTLEVLDLLGRKVETLVDRFQDAGEHEIAWRPGDLPSGVYFYSLRTGDYEASRRMTLLR